MVLHLIRAVRRVQPGVTAWKRRLNQSPAEKVKWETVNRVGVLFHNLCQGQRRATPGRIAYLVHASRRG